MEHNANLAPRSNADQLAAQVARRIEYARSVGLALDDGNVIDYLADNMTRATLDELRAALSRTIYAKDFPKAIQARRPTRTLRPEQYAVNTTRPVKFTATFADGQKFTRTSKRPYTHAWRLTCQFKGQQNTNGGFASSAELAREAAAHWERRAVKVGGSDCRIEIVEAQK